MARPIVTRTRSVAAIAALLVLSGCSLLRNTIGAYETGPNGIAKPQQELREALVRSDFAVALGWHEDDALLRALGMGTSSYYASQFARSVAVLDSAALLADDRITNSVSANAVALISNDLARPYQARRTERLFIPYYAMLAYARLEQWEDAAVEARRLSGLLAQYAGDRTDAERATHATLHYLSGVVQVAYRLARALLPEQVDSARTRPAKSEGEILVVLERGFVAHRATETISIFLGDDEDEYRRRHRDGDSRDLAKLAARMASVGSADTTKLKATPDGTHRRRHDDDDADDDDYYLRVAFPSVRRTPRLRGDARLVVDGETANVIAISSLLDDAVSADEGMERPRLVHRLDRDTSGVLVLGKSPGAAAKLAVTKAVKDKKGEVAGTLANIGASLLERADVRSWHLLPQTVTLLRVRLPAGQHRLQLDVGEGLSRIDMGDVMVRAGELTLASTRAWREGMQPSVLAVSH